MCEYSRIFCMLIIFSCSILLCHLETMKTFQVMMMLSSHGTEIHVIFCIWISRSYPLLPWPQGFGSFPWLCMHGLLYSLPSIVCPTITMVHSICSQLLHQPFACTDTYSTHMIQSCILNWNVLVKMLYLLLLFLFFQCKLFSAYDLFSLLIFLYLFCLPLYIKVSSRVVYMCILAIAILCVLCLM